MKRVGSQFLALLVRVPVPPAPQAVFWFLVIAIMMTTGPHPASARTVCFDNAEQSKLVADNEIVPVSTALTARKVQKRGKFIEAEICRNQKGFFYKMTVQSDAGELNVVRVRASPSAPPSDLHLKRNCYFTGRSWSTGSICKLECNGDLCPRQYCKANGEWQPLPRCQLSSSCQAYRSC